MIFLNSIIYFLLDIFILNIGLWNVIFILSIFYFDNYYYSNFVFFINILLLTLKTKNGSRIVILENIYFKQRKGEIIFNDNKDNYNKQCIYCYHPHGNLPLALCGLFNTSFFNNTICLVSSIMFYIPFINLLLFLRGDLCKITSINIDKIIELKKNVLLCPGGVNEMLLCEDNKINIYTKHKGFIKKAIKYGLQLVPIFCFGENRSCVNNIKNIEKFLYKKFKITIPGIQTNDYYLPISNKTKVTYIIGKPVNVEQKDIIEEDYINEIEKEYYDELSNIFNKYRNKYYNNGNNVQLEFI